MINSSLNYKSFLVAGATGGSGIEIVNLLLAQNKHVSIIGRNKTKAKTVFKENYEKIDKIIEHELGLSQLKCDLEPKYNEELLEAIDNCDVFICSLGVTSGGDPQQSDYMATVELLNHCAKSKNKFDGKLFIYISTMYITRPFTLVSFILNSMFPYVMGWKALAENRLRQSGLNYLIVRPAGLTNKSEKKTVEVLQGDNISSMRSEISRRNLANVIYKIMSDPDINKGKVTLELIETAKSEGDYIIKSPIKVDDKDSIIISDHFKTTRNINFVIYGVLTLLFLWILCKFK